MIQASSPAKKGDVGLGLGLGSHMTDTTTVNNNYNLTSSMVVYLDNNSEYLRRIINDLETLIVKKLDLIVKSSITIPEITNSFKDLSSKVSSLESHIKL